MINITPSLICTKYKTGHMYRLIIKDLRNGCEFTVLKGSQKSELQRRADSLNQSNNTPHYHAYVVAKR